MAQAESFRIRQQNGEFIYALLVGEEVVCTARTCAHRLVKIITESGQRRKGHATKLLRHVEVMERKNGAKFLDTTDIDSTDDGVVDFFTKNDYVLTPIAGDEEFLEGKKKLG
jgi:hypothetical protein